MKVLQVIFVLVISTFTLSGSLFGQVKLVTEVIGKEYSEGDADLKAVDLKLKLQFSNSGQTPILIYRNKFDVSHIWVSKNVEDLISGVFEQSSSLTNLVSNVPSIKKLGVKDFVILSKNEKYETQETIRLFVPYDSNNKIAGAVSTGTHTLRIRFYNWFWTKEESENKQSELIKYGNIMMNPVVSEPMTFTIE